VADAAPVPPGTGEAFDYSEGTAPGSSEAMSERDAVIVRCIRMRCPDNRYEDSSDVELLQLFKRNRKVLGRTVAASCARRSRSASAEPAPWA
jgi:hypothetical protein